jgi:hypothetical protein
MSIKVYRVTPDGTLVQRGAEVVALGTVGGPVPLRLVFPPCACPRCRSGLRPDGRRVR